MSDTPRTDSCYQQILDECLGLEYAEDELREWSKKLERELAEAQAEIVRLTKRKDECSNGWDGALATVQQLKRELAEAVAAERERCARVCEERGSFNSMYAHHILTGAAAAIRKGE
jgi:uncharacterized protein with von Willebrand factor type A (vWA) domain